MPAKRDWLIIADGELLPWPGLLALAAERSVMVLDGAYTEALCQQVRADVVLGDLDSIAPVLLEALLEEDPSRLYRDSDQESTDLDKGLQYLKEQHARSVLICNATGRRMDHTLYNLGLLKRFHGVFEELRLVTPWEEIVYLQDQRLGLKSGEERSLAVMSFPEAVVSSRGLAYEMRDLRLSVGGQESVSNTLLKGEGEIEVRGAVLLMLSPV